jgi:hypothetical protein
MTCLAVFFDISAGLSQAPPSYGLVDDFARNFPLVVHDRDGLDAMIRSVDSRFTLPEEKIRAVFTWIATHLEYDCGTEDRPAQKGSSLDQVLKSGRSQCAGYSSLLQYCLRSLGFESTTIKGVAKTGRKDLWWTIADLRTNHSWNAVKLHNQWQLMDPTWASGAADDNCETITREFSDFYFFPDPEKFALSHLPDDSSWQLTMQPMTREKFLSIPVFHDPFYEHAVIRFSPMEGLQKKKLFETIRFEFNSATPLERIAIWSDGNKAVKPEFGNFTRSGNTYVYTYKLGSPGSYFLNVSLDGKRTALLYYVEGY